MAPRFHARVPGAPLDGFVELIWDSEGAPSGRLEEVLPFGKSQLFVELGDDRVHWVRAPDDRLRLSGPVVQGPLTRPLLVDPADQRRLLGASLRPWGLAALTRAPVHSLRDRLVELRALSPVELGPARDRLARARTADARLDVFEALLSPLFAAADRRIGPELKVAAHRLDACGDLGIRPLADELGLSQRRFSERFAAAIGMKPKTWQRVRRFRRSLPLLEAGRPATEIAHRLGHADQPHFNHEFRRFSGRSPSGYLRSARSYQGHLVLG